MSKFNGLLGPVLGDDPEAREIAEDTGCTIEQAKEALREAYMRYQLPDNPYTEH